MTVAAQWYPLALKEDQGTTGGRMIGGEPRGVIHSNCGRFSSRPFYHIWFGGRTELEVVQFRPFNRASKALRNPAGGVQTNRQGDWCINLCMAGAAGDPDGRPLFIYEGVRQFIEWCEAQFGIPRTYPVDKPVLGGRCFGSGSPCRFTNTEWEEFTGWCEHKNVPENTHWDANLPHTTLDQLMSDDPITIPPGEVSDMYQAVQLGDDKPAVGEWQHVLNLLGAGLKVDNDYGPKTRTAVATFSSGDGERIGPTEGAEIIAATDLIGSHKHPLPDHTHGGVST